MELDEVDAIARDLLAIGGFESAALELDHRNDSVAEQHAVHAESTTTKVVFEDDMAILHELRRTQRRPENLDLMYTAPKPALQHADARAPLVVLFVLDV